MSFSIFIPARYNSERLPGKLLLKINNKTLLQHAYECAQKANPEQIIICCDHEKVAEHASSLGAKVVMTSPECPNGTARIASALLNNKLNLSFNDSDIIVNLQADEIIMPKEYIKLVADNLANSIDCVVATLAKPIKSLNKLLDPNVVKIVKNNKNEAMYFSRSTVPHIRSGLTQENFTKYDFWHHIGLYAYKVGFLKVYNNLAKTNLEDVESLEQLRILAHGYKIHVGEVAELATLEINTQEDFDNAILQFNGGT
jgi:3-deoxy-manno-octulosonate cytidylyltransferase (CMP-KDO synthetase)